MLNYLQQTKEVGGTIIKKQNRKSTATGAGLVGLIVLIVAGVALINPNQHAGKSTRSSDRTTQVRNNSQPDHQSTQAGDATQLAELTYQSGQDPIKLVNHGKSTLNPDDWKSVHVEYGDLDDLNRTTTDVAYLNQTTLTRSANRPGQRWQPTGWHNQPKRVDGKRIYPQSRGHLIAYSITGNLNQEGQFQQGALGSIDNPKNLATQSAFSNQVLMQIYEEKVRSALQQHKRVIYRVQTVFRNQELMPRGYWLQAISTDKSVNFNVYLFNVQNKIPFDYATGRSTVEQNFRVPRN